MYPLTIAACPATIQFVTEQKIGNVSCMSLIGLVKSQMIKLQFTFYSLNMHHIMHYIIKHTSMFISSIESVILAVVVSEILRR